MRTNGTSDTSGGGDRTLDLLKQYEQSQGGGGGHTGADDDDDDTDDSAKTAGQTPAADDKGDSDKDGDKAKADAKGSESEDDDADDDAAKYKLDSLDPELAKSPALAKRWAEQQRGVDKLVGELKEAKKVADDAAAEFATITEEMKPVFEWGDIFSDPERVADGIADFIPKLAESHGLTVGELLGKLDLQALLKKADEIDEQEVQANYEKEGFDTPGEYRAFLRAKLEFQKAERDKAKKANADRTTQTQAEKQQKARETFIKEVAPKVVDEVAKRKMGFKVTPQQVAEAVDAFPQLAKEPYKAVAAHFEEEITKHLTSKTAETPKADELTPSTSSKSDAVKLPPPGERKAIDIMRANGMTT